MWGVGRGGGAWGGWAAGAAMHIEHCEHAGQAEPVRNRAGQRCWRVLAKVLCVGALRAGWVGGVGQQVGQVGRQHEAGGCLASRLWKV